MKRSIGSTRKETEKLESDKKEISREFNVPLTSYQFEADYKELKSNDEKFFAYFKVSIKVLYYCFNIV